MIFAKRHEDKNDSGYKEHHSFVKNNNIVGTQRLRRLELCNGSIPLTCCFLSGDKIKFKGHCYNCDVWIYDVNQWNLHKSHDLGFSKSIVGDES